MYKMSDVKQRCTNFMYVQQLKYLKLSIDEIYQRLIDDKDVKDFALIVHDKDVKDDNLLELAEEHLHAFISFKQQKSLQYVSRLISDEENRIDFFNRDTVPDKNERNGFLYLLHKTKGSAHKHQYSIDELILPPNSNLKVRIKKWEKNYQNFLSKTSDNKRKHVVKQHLESYANLLLDYDELEQKLTSLELAQNSTLIKNIDDLRIKKKHADYVKHERYKDKKVIYIYGASGTGKSRLSKRIANNFVDDNKDVYVTSSNRDPFQNYMSEKVIILEEFRATTGISENELFQILDKSNSTFSAGARYRDKLLMPELVIINSIHAPTNILNTERLDTMQLYRRLDAVIRVDKLNIATQLLDEKTEQYYDFETKHNDIYVEPKKLNRLELNQILEGEF
ncbi:DNA replication protein DnaC [Staphylococcus hominis]